MHFASPGLGSKLKILKLLKNKWFLQRSQEMSLVNVRVLVFCVVLSLQIMGKLLKKEKDKEVRRERGRKESRKEGGEKGGRQGGREGGGFPAAPPLIHPS